MKVNAQIITLCLSLLTACNPMKEAEEEADCLPDIFPDYTSIVIPYNIAPLNFEVKKAQTVQAEFVVEKIKLITVRGDNEIQIPLKKWRNLLASAKGKELNIIVSVWNDTHPKGIRYRPFSIYVAPDKIDSHIAYRLIEPGYEGWNVMGIYQRDLTSFEEKAIVTNQKDKSRCMNCHTFNNYSSDDVLFHVRGENGGTALYTGGILRKIEFEKLPSHKNVGFPAWHPGRRYIAFSSSKSGQVFFGAGEQVLEVFNTGGDLLLYDTQTGKMVTDKRFISKAAWMDFPVWSADGKFLYYCVADPRNLPREYRQVHYHLGRVGFNEPTGLVSEKIDTLYNAHAQGGSVAFFSASPDGRYLLYTKADYGIFPIWHKESDVEMIRLGDGQSVDVSVWNSDCAESYHTWSSNGRWVLISSRRLDGRYTRVFIAYMDEAGKPYKPFLLPQQHPIDNILRIKSYNLPKFIRGEVKLPTDLVNTLFFPSK